MMYKRQKNTMRLPTVLSAMTEKALFILRGSVLVRHLSATRDVAVLREPSVFK
jgi:hypothetical protein